MTRLAALVDRVIFAVYDALTPLSRRERTVGDLDEWKLPLDA